MENGAISATGGWSYQYEGAGLIGIRAKLSSDETVTVSNVEITLELTSRYKADETAALRLCGIMSGSQWFEPRSDYDGTVVVVDCNVVLTAVEEDGDPNEDGAGIMLDGVCVRGGGTVELKGDTTIEIERTAAGNAADGYEYSLNNENGTLTVEQGVVYDDEKTKGVIE